MASPKISIISERFNFQNIIQNNWLGKKTRASNKDPLSKSNCIFPFCPLSFNFCYFPSNEVQELFPCHPLKSYLDSRASCGMLSLKYISPYETIAIHSHYSSVFYIHKEPMQFSNIFCVQQSYFAFFVNKSINTRDEIYDKSSNYTKTKNEHAQVNFIWHDMYLVN